MESDLFLNPPTYGEFLFATCRFGDYIDALEQLTNWGIKSDLWFALLSGKFELPLEFRRGDGLDYDLASLISSIEDGTDYNFSLPEGGHYEYHSMLFERLRPKTTFEAGNGDCKSLA